MTFLTPSIVTLQVLNKPASEFFNTPSAINNGRLTLTDHSRSPFSIDYDRIEKASRMADGTLRKYLVSQKRSFSCSWSMLPTIDSMVVDANANAERMKTFYEMNSGLPMGMTLFSHRNSTSNNSYTEYYKVFWESFDYEIVKRYKDFDYWDISASFTEI